MNQIQKEKVDEIKKLLANMQNEVMIRDIPDSAKAEVLQNTILIWRILKELEVLN